MSRTIQRRVATALIALSLTVLVVAPAAAWSNGPSSGNGYGTHDWIIDQALKTFNGHVPSWLNASTARLASDDPDTLFWRTNEHVYMEEGYGRGAVHMVSAYYDRTMAALKAGDNALASAEFGRMAHFWADLYVPFHTAYAAVSKGAAHEAYERLVDAKHRNASSAPEWETGDRSPGTVTDVRAYAIAGAAYSRSYYPELYSEFMKNQTTLTARASTITGYVLKRASRELGDLLNSLTKSVGSAPMVVKLVAKMKYAQPSSIEYQAIYITATDAAGKPIEGLRIDVTWPTSADVPNGTEPFPHVFRAYTMPDGIAKATAYIDLSKHGQKQTVKIVATMRGKTVATTISYTAK
jgi:hypothetical protein